MKAGFIGNVNFPQPSNLRGWLFMHPGLTCICERIHCRGYSSICVSGITGRQSAPQRLLSGKFLLTYWEKVARKKLKRGEEKKENWKNDGKVSKWGDYPPFFLLFSFLFSFFLSFFFFFFLLFSFEMKMAKIVPKWGEDPFFLLSLFKTAQICFGCTKMEIFYREKSISHREKNQEKWLCPLRKIFLLCPWCRVFFTRKSARFYAFRYKSTPSTALPSMLARTKICKRTRSEIIGYFRCLSLCP